MLKQASFCYFQRGLSHDILFAKFWRGHRFVQILRKPKVIVQGFFSRVRKKVLRKVYHIKVNEKRNLMALVSVA